METMTTRLFQELLARFDQRICSTSRAKAGSIMDNCSAHNVNETVPHVLPSTKYDLNAEANGCWRYCSYGTTFQITSSGKLS